MNRMRSEVWKGLMEQATGGDGQGASSGGAAGGGDAAAAAAATAAAAAAAGNGGATGGTGQQTGQSSQGAQGSSGQGQQQQGGSQGNGSQGAQGASQVPEKYEIKLPEATKLTQADVDAVAVIAKAKALTNDQAQMLLDQRHEASEAATAAATTKLTEIKTGWLNELKADTAFGGDALDKNGELAANAIKAFGGEDLLKSIKEAGFNLHPGFFRMMVKIGKAMGEDTGGNASGATGGGAKKDAATVLYG